MFSVKVYSAADYAIWNTFVNDAKNGTFLFHRDFMEYHQDRFDDFSLLVFKNDKLKLATTILLFEAVLQFLKSNGFDKMFIKLIPSIYHKKPAEDLSYILFLLNAKLLKRDALSVIDLRENFKLSKDRKEGIKRGLNNKLEIREEQDFTPFWEQILMPNLQQKHQTNPVHSIEEISILKNKFPQNIRQFNVYFDNKIVAGTTIFESENVAHSQYIASNENKNELGSLDFLHHYLLIKVFKDKKYFDFGISNENQGRNLNQGLSYWKSTFGASTIVQDYYEITTDSFKQLDKVLL